MIRGIDHVVILVRDLQSAIDDYQALGFTVTPGGEHADGSTHNALIPFADGSYFELIAFKRDAPHHRWWKHVARGEGLIDFALLPSDTATDIAAMSERGLHYEGPTAGGRTRPDGQRLEWQTGLPTSSGLPFLCGDVTPRDLRVPGGAARSHPNGVSGISGITVAVDDADEAAKQYAALLDRPTPPTAHIAPLGINIAVFELDRDAIALAQPTEGSELADHLAANGPGIYSISLLTEGDASEDWPDAERAHGVRMELHKA